MKHNPSVSILKRQSKELFKLLKNKNLKEMDIKQSKQILTALDVLISMNKESSQKSKSNPIIVNGAHGELGRLPIAYANTVAWKKPSVWSLTDQGLREQVVMYGCIGAGCDELLVSLGGELIKNQKGLVHLDGQGNMTLYSKLFNICYENKILDRLKFIKPVLSDHQEQDGLSHSLNIISGMNQEQLSVWMYTVMQTWEESSPELFEKIPQNSWRTLKLIANIAINLCGKDKFLTLNLLNHCFEISLEKAKAEQEKEVECQSLWLKLLQEFLEQEELKNDLMLVSLLWKQYLSPFVEGRSSLGEDYADVHLLPAIKNKEIIIISKPYYYDKAFTNMIGASISVARAYVGDEEEVQSVVIAEHYRSCFSPYLIKTFSSLRQSNIGLIWHTNLEENQKSCFSIPPSTAIVMKLETLDLSEIDEKYRNELLKNGVNLTKDLREGQGYVLSKNSDLKFESPTVTKMSIPYTPIKRIDSSVFITKEKKYRTMDEITRELNRNQSEELFERNAYILCSACLYPGDRTRASLSWCQETMAKIMGYSSQHHACQENSR